MTTHRLSAADRALWPIEWGEVDRERAVIAAAQGIAWDARLNNAVRSGHYNAAVTCRGVRDSAFVEAAEALLWWVRS